MGFDAATALISALSLFFARLDSFRRRSGELPDLQRALIEISSVLRTWTREANITNRTFRRYVEGNITIDVANRQLKTSLYGQAASMRRAALSLLDENNGKLRWQSARNILELYGKELLGVLEVGIKGRGDLISELIAELPHLREVEATVLQEKLRTLELTNQELDRASTKLDDYIRERFPLGGNSLLSLRSRELASVADARVRATSVPEGVENYDHQRSATGTANGL